MFKHLYDFLLRGRGYLQCNELNRGQPTFFYQSQDEFRTKEPEFVHFGPIKSEGLTAKSLFPSTKRQLKGKISARHTTSRQCRDMFTRVFLDAIPSDDIELEEPL